jgi:hypothetical protein
MTTQRIGVLRPSPQYGYGFSVGRLRWKVTDENLNK